MKKNEIGHGIAFFSVLPFIFYFGAVLNMQGITTVFVLLSLGYLLFPLLIISPPEAIKATSKYIPWAYIGYMIFVTSLYVTLGESISPFGWASIFSQCFVFLLCILYMRMK